MRLYWVDHPPANVLLDNLKQMTATKWGFKSRTVDPVGQPIEDAAQFIPVTPIKAADFNAVLASHGLPHE